MATTEDMSQSSAADGIKMLPKSDLVGKNQESRDILIPYEYVSAYWFYELVREQTREICSQKFPNFA